MSQKRFQLSNVWLNKRGEVGLIEWSKDGVRSFTIMRGNYSFGEKINFPGYLGGMTKDRALTSKSGQYCLISAPLDGRFFVYRYDIDSARIKTSPPVYSKIISVSEVDEPNSGTEQTSFVVCTEDLRCFRIDQKFDAFHELPYRGRKIRFAYNASSMSSEITCIIQKSENKLAFVGPANQTEVSADSFSLMDFYCLSEGVLILEVCGSVRFLSYKGEEIWRHAPRRGTHALSACLTQDALLRTIIYDYEGSEPATVTDLCQEDGKVKHQAALSGDGGLGGGPFYFSNLGEEIMCGNGSVYNKFGKEVKSIADL